ncbi:MAG: hypothetical protein IJ597_05125 [Synergistaceae bacterium]|nr:hypothetical protein [Synergistaceae bacterium]
MQKILRKYHGLKNKKRNRRSRLLFGSQRLKNENYFEISAKTLAMIESSMENFKRGIVFGPIDLSN